MHTVAAAAAAAALSGSLAYLRCAALAPSGVCAPGGVELAALDLASGNSTLLARFANASSDLSLELQNLAVAPAADALFISLPDAGVTGGGGASGQLVRWSLSGGAVVSSVPAPACAFLAVDDVPAPTSALCLTDAPFYGEDGRSYLLRLDLATGAPTLLATWDGSPVPDDVVAVYDPASGVLFADLLDEAADAEYLLGWDVATGRLASQVAVPPSVVFVAALWAPPGAPGGGAEGRVLGVVNNYTSQTRVLAGVDLATGAVDAHPASTALTRFTTVYGTAAFAPAAGTVFVTALGSDNTVRIVGVNATSGALDANLPAGEVLGAFAYLGAEL